MAIYLNNNNDTGGVLQLSSPSMMVIPAIGCSLQIAYFIYNYILYKYEHYNILTIETNIPEEECSICLENLRTSKSCKLKCNHYYHYNCVMEHFKNNNKCPICRTEFILGQV